MQILVTGGAGYLGSVLVPELLALGHLVTVIDNFYYNQTSLLSSCHLEAFQIIRGDARDKDLIATHMKRADVIIPLACLTGAPLCDLDPVGARSVNFDAIKMLLRIRSTDQQIIFPTTNSGYGVGQKSIFCTEKTSLNPTSLYGRLKVEIEKMLLDAGNCITMRLSTVFGPSPRMRVDLLVNDFTYRAVMDRFLVLFQAHFKRNYIHVKDVTRAFVHCMDQFDTMVGEPYNVGLSDANLSKWELCETIRQIIPDFYFVEAEIGEDPDKRDYIVSNEKIEKTGFLPRYSLEQGIEALSKAYQIARRNQHANI